MSFNSELYNEARKELLLHIPREALGDVTCTYTKMGSKRIYTVEIRSPMFPKNLIWSGRAEDFFDAKYKCFHAMIQRYANSGTIAECIETGIIA